MSERVEDDEGESVGVGESVGESVRASLREGIAASSAPPRVWIHTSASPPPRGQPVEITGSPDMVRGDLVALFGHDPARPLGIYRVARGRGTNAPGGGRRSVTAECTVALALPSTTTAERAPFRAALESLAATTAQRDARSANVQTLLEDTLRGLYAKKRTIVDRLERLFAGAPDDDLHVDADADAADATVDLVEAAGKPTIHLHVLAEDSVPRSRILLADDTDPGPHLFVVRGRTIRPFAIHVAQPAGSNADAVLVPALDLSAISDGELAPYQSELEHLIDPSVPADYRDRHARMVGVLRRIYARTPGMDEQIVTLLDGGAPPTTHQHPQGEQRAQQQRPASDAPSLLPRGERIWIHVRDARSGGELPPGIEAGEHIVQLDRTEVLIPVAIDEVVATASRELTTRTRYRFRAIPDDRLRAAQPYFERPRTAEDRKMTGSVVPWSTQRRDELLRVLVDLYEGDTDSIVELRQLLESVPPASPARQDVDAQRVGGEGSLAAAPRRGPSTDPARELIWVHTREAGTKPRYAELPDALSRGDLVLMLSPGRILIPSVLDEVIAAQPSGLGLTTRIRFPALGDASLQRAQPDLHGLAGTPGAKTWNRVPRGEVLAVLARMYEGARRTLGELERVLAPAGEPAPDASTAAPNAAPTATSNEGSSTASKATSSAAANAAANAAPRPRLAEQRIVGDKPGESAPSPSGASSPAGSANAPARSHTTPAAAAILQAPGGSRLVGAPAAQSVREIVAAATSPEAANDTAATTPDTAATTPDTAAATPDTAATTRDAATTTPDTAATARASIATVPADTATTAASIATTPVASTTTVIVQPFVPSTPRDDDDVFWLSVDPARVDARWRSTPSGAGTLDGRLLEALTAPNPGQALYQAIMNAPAIAMQAGQQITPVMAFARVRDQARRVLLELQDNALQQLPWEAMAGELAQFGIEEKLPIARFVRGRDCEPVAGPLRVACVVANPKGLGDPTNLRVAELAPIDVAAERARVRAAVAPLLEAAGELVLVDATREAIVAELANGPHVLHVVAHGLWSADKEDYGLVLESREGGLDICYLGERGDTTNLLSILASSEALRVVVLGCCFSGAFHATGKVSLGARLAEVVPTVVAMQDAITPEAVGAFAKGFYAGLAKTGETDRAAAAGRLAMQHQLPKLDRQWTLPAVFVGTTRPRVYEPDDTARASGGAAMRALREPARPVDRGIASAAREAGASLALGDQIAAAVQAAVAPLVRDARGGGASVRSAGVQQDRDAIARGIAAPVQLPVQAVLDVVGEHGSELVLPDEVAHQAVAAINSGKHVIFIGPPGTGKTTLTTCLTRLAEGARFATGTIAATASADWSTAETVGALLPSRDGVAFRPGLVLDAILEGKWLVIDEINRAEIDKAFGELFTILSGQPITIPFGHDACRARVLPPHRDWRTRLPAAVDARWSAAAWEPADATAEDIVVHPNFRILASMNVYDRSFLFSMSLAFMRRFAFIDVDLPSNYGELIDHWLDPAHKRRLLAMEPAVRAQLRRRVLALIAPDADDACGTLQRHRALGPAILADVLRYIQQRGAAEATWPVAFAEGVALYVVPQLDGLAPEVVEAIEKELAVLFPRRDARRHSLVCTRLRALYPHVFADD